MTELNADMSFCKYVGEISFLVIFYLSNGKKAPVLVLISSNNFESSIQVLKKKTTANELISTISGLETISGLKPLGVAIG